MKAFTREFTKKELALIGVLVLIIVAFVYYMLVQDPVSRRIKNAEDNKMMLEDELILVEAQVQQVLAMRAEMEALNKEGALTGYMPSYNSSKAEYDFLNSTLAATQDYYVGFTQVTRNGNQIRRSFSLQYKADDFNTAVGVLRTLEGYGNRCLVGDVTINPTQRDEGVMDGQVQMNLSGTFYETMQGGVADKELPPDSNPAPTPEPDAG